MRTLILEIQKGGLGDHLFYSHLPRIAKATGAYDTVLLSTRSICRNPETMELVWKKNPYLDGFTDQPGTFHFAETLMPEENLLDRIMLRYGLDDGIRYHEPELYYQPAKLPELANATLYDPNFISYTGDLQTGRLVEAWLKEHEVHLTCQMKQLGQRSLPVACSNEYQSKNLADFCSVLVSCKKMYCLTTGTATLAAALGVPLTVFYGTGLDPIYRHSRIHEYVHLGTDYTLKDHLKKSLVQVLRKFIPMGTP